MPIIVPDLTNLEYFQRASCDIILLCFVFVYLGFLSKICMQNDLVVERKITTLDIHKVMENHKLYYGTGATKEFEFRISKLRLLRDAIVKHEDEILEALKRDLNKAPFEAYETRLGSPSERYVLQSKTFESGCVQRKFRHLLYTFPLQVGYILSLMGLRILCLHGTILSSLR